jgi:hypothetical protein
VGLVAQRARADSLINHAASDDWQGAAAGGRLRCVLNLQYQRIAIQGIQLHRTTQTVDSPQPKESQEDLPLNMHSQQEHVAASLAIPVSTPRPMCHSVELMLFSGCMRMRMLGDEYFVWSRRGLGDLTSRVGGANGNT